MLHWGLKGYVAIKSAPLEADLMNEWFTDNRIDGIFGLLISQNMICFRQNDLGNQVFANCCKSDELKL